MSDAGCQLNHNIFLQDSLVGIFEVSTDDSLKLAQALK